MDEPFPQPHFGSAQAVAVSQDEFLQHMTAMQQHYRGVDPTGAQPIVSYVLPQHLLFLAPGLPTVAGTAPPAQETQRSPAPLSPNEAAKQNFARLVALGTPAAESQAIADALHDQHQRTLDFINTHRDAVTNAITDARKSASTQAFVQQMDALRDQAKANHEARIDAMFARLIAIGTAHSAARPVVLNTGNKVGGFVGGVAGEFGRLVGTMKSAASAGAAAVGKAAESVGQWASGAVQSVGHFFSGLF